MAPALMNHNGFICHGINKAVFIPDASGPHALHRFGNRVRLSNALEGGIEARGDQSVYSIQGRTVSLMYPRIVLCDPVR